MQNKNSNQSRKFHVLPLGEYKAELFIPVLIPYSNNNEGMKSNRYENSQTGEKLAMVRVMLLSFDNQFASFTSRTNFKNEKKFYAKMILAKEEDIFNDQELEFGKSPFKNQLTALQFFVQDEPRYEGQSPLYGLNNFDEEKYENYTFIVANCQEEFDKLKAYGNDIIRTNLELTANRRPQDIKTNFTAKQVRESFTNKEACEAYLQFTGKNRK